MASGAARLPSGALLFASLLGTPWLFFVSTAVPLYLKNRDELGGGLAVLAPFVAAALAAAVASQLAIVALRSTGARTSAALLSFAWYLAGVAWLAASFAPGARGPLVPTLAAVLVVAGAFACRRLDPRPAARVAALAGPILRSVGVAAAERYAGVPLIDPVVTDLRRTRYYHFYEKKGPNEWTDEMARFRIERDRVASEGAIPLLGNPRPE